MTRSQRRRHAQLWLALGPLILLGLLVALAARPPAPLQEETLGSAGHDSGIGAAQQSLNEELKP